MAKVRKRMGRPPKVAKAGERYSLGLKVTADVKQLIDEAAQASGRTQSQEAERRLQRSFDRRRDLIGDWGEDVFNIAESAAKSLWHIERYTGKRWAEDEQTFDLFQRTVAELIRNYRDLVVRTQRTVPDRTYDGKTKEELAQMFAAQGGISPPRPREKNDPKRAAAERAASIDEYKKSLAESGARPLPSEVH